MDLLEPAKERPDGREVEPKEFDFEKDLNDYVVKKIVDSTQNEDNELYYLVKWKGYSEDENTWEPGRNLEHLKTKVRDFRKAEASKAKAQKDTATGMTATGNSDAELRRSSRRAAAKH